ncbi:MAG: hypothetical protein KDE27_12270 [Planctomycetes bacterium]|nr:hypothetical protein [Planctomycetota bacterium]
MFRELDPGRVIETIERLRDRIRERFPAAHLGQVADELVALSRAHAARSAAIGRPDIALRALSVGLIVVGVAGIALAAWLLHVESDPKWTVKDMIQTAESGLSALFFLGAGAVFTMTIELRNKRSRCLKALHELRAMAHIVDMHQLTKDPDRLMNPGTDTPNSPQRSLTRFELSRYLDYCSEMLSLMGKVAALYGQNFPDSEARQGVDEIEDLTTSLARKIWQKIMILGESEREREPTGAEPAPPPLEAH